MTDIDPTPDPPRPPVEHPCEADPFSIVGLKTLARTDPDGWRRRLRDGPPPEQKDELAAAMKRVIAEGPPATPDDGPTLRQVLLLFSTSLQPVPGSKIGIEVVRQARQLLAMVNEMLGHWPAAHFVEHPQTVGQHVHFGQPRSGRAPLTAARTHRADGLVRAALDHWRRVTGASAVADPAPVTTRQRRPARRTIPLRVALRGFVEATPAERVKLGLPLGAGLSAPEIEALQALGGRGFAEGELRGALASRLGLPSGRLHFAQVQHPQDPARVRWSPLPPWLGALVVDAKAGGTPPLAGAPRLSSTLRRLRRSDPELELTPLILRTTWQAVMRRAGASRELVRGTWWQPSEGPNAWPNQWHRAQFDAWRVASMWELLGSGPGAPFVDRIDKVPAKAPSRVAPHEPELRGRRRRTVRTPLPERMSVG